MNNKFLTVTPGVLQLDPAPLGRMLVSLAPVIKSPNMSYAYRKKKRKLANFVLTKIYEDSFYPPNAGPPDYLVDHWTISTLANAFPAHSWEEYRGAVELLLANKHAISRPCSDGPLDQETIIPDNRGYRGRAGRVLWQGKPEGSFGAIRNGYAMDAAHPEYPYCSPRIGYFYSEPLLSWKIILLTNQRSAMAIEIGAYTIKTILGKGIDWLRATLIKWGRLRFYDLKVTYCYSFYDEREYHVRTGGKKQIYEVNCAVTIINESQGPKIIRNVRMAVMVGGVRFPLTVFDAQLRQPKPTYSLAGKEARNFAWNAFRPTIGKAPGHTGLVPIDPSDASIAFLVEFEDKKNRTIQHFVEVAEARMLDPRRIAE